MFGDALNEDHVNEWIDTVRSCSLAQRNYGRQHRQARFGISQESVGMLIDYQQDERNNGSTRQRPSLLRATS